MSTITTYRVPTGLQAGRLAPPGLPAEAAGQAHDVVIWGQHYSSVDDITQRSTCGETGEGWLCQAKLLAVPPVGNLLDNLIIESLQFVSWQPLEGPGAVSAPLNCRPAQADLLEIIRPIPSREVVTSTLQTVL